MYVFGKQFRLRLRLRTRFRFRACATFPRGHGQRWKSIPDVSRCDLVGRVSRAHSIPFSKTVALSNANPSPNSFTFAFAIVFTFTFSTPDPPPFTAIAMFTNAFGSTNTSPKTYLETIWDELTSAFPCS